MRLNGNVLVLVLMGIVALGYVSLLVFSPLQFQIIDRDKSGIISLFEALDSADIGKRGVDGKPNCIEYFWLKDGLPAYETCTDVVSYYKSA